MGWEQDKKGVVGGQKKRKGVGVWRRYDVVKRQRVRWTLSASTRRAAMAAVRGRELSGEAELTAQRNITKFVLSNALFSRRSLGDGASCI